MRANRQRTLERKGRCRQSGKAEHDSEAIRTNGSNPASAAATLRELSWLPRQRPRFARAKATPRILGPSEWSSRDPLPRSQSDATEAPFGGTQVYSMRRDGQSDAEETEGRLLPHTAIRITPLRFLHAIRMQSKNRTSHQGETGDKQQARIQLFELIRATEEVQRPPSWLQCTR